MQNEKSIRWSASHFLTLPSTSPACRKKHLCICTLIIDTCSIHTHTFLIKRKPTFISAQSLSPTILCQSISAALMAVTDIGASSHITDGRFTRLTAFLSYLSSLTSSSLIASVYIPHSAICLWKLHHQLYSMLYSLYTAATPPPFPLWSSLILSAGSVNLVLGWWCLNHRSLMQWPCPMMIIMTVHHPSCRPPTLLHPSLLPLSVSLPFHLPLIIILHLPSSILLPLSLSPPSLYLKPYSSTYLSSSFALSLSHR